MVIQKLTNLIEITSFFVFWNLILAFDTFSIASKGRRQSTFLVWVALVVFRRRVKASRKIPKHAIYLLNDGCLNKSFNNCYVSPSWPCVCDKLFKQPLFLNYTYFWYVFFMQLSPLWNRSEHRNWVKQYYLLHFIMSKSYLRK